MAASLPPSVGEVYFELRACCYTQRRTILYFECTNPLQNEFSRFETLFRQMHGSAIALLRALDIHPESLVLLGFGLRINEHSWTIPPPTPRAGLEEIEAIVRALGRLVNPLNEHLSVPDFDAASQENTVRMRGQFRMASQRFMEESTNPRLIRGMVGVALRGIRTGFRRLMNQLVESPHAPVTGLQFFNRNRTIRRQGVRWSPRRLWESRTTRANESHGNTVPRDASDVVNTGALQTGNPGVEECSICLEELVAGQDIKCLQCSHSFHKDCIDLWLSTKNTCPLDRSPV